VAEGVNTVAREIAQVVPAVVGAGQPVAEGLGAMRAGSDLGSSTQKDPEASIGKIPATIDAETEKLMESLKSLNPNDKHHILQEKHNWWKVVKNPRDWEQVERIIRRVLTEGCEKPHKKVLKKALQIDTNIVEVTYRKFNSGNVKVGNGWVI